MNLLNKKWLKFKNKSIKVYKEDGKLRIVNDSDTHGFLVWPHLFHRKDGKAISISFFGKNVNGNGAVFQLLNFSRDILSETSFNSESSYLIDEDKFFCSIKINRKSEVIIEKMDLKVLQETVDEFAKILGSDNQMLIITPSYPTEENKYFGGFVHSRVKAYKESGINFDLICAHNYGNSCNYNFEGIDVLRTNFQGLREVLTKKKYKTILLHFFDNEYAKILDACDMSETNLFLWVHGPETLYWDWSKMTDHYFEKETELTLEQIKKFKENDELINRYNNYDNVHWIFVSEWIKNRSEELINIKFNHYSVIPNFVDSETFNYVEKDPELRKKIFFVRRFENISKYAIDVNVRTILELSRRECFKDLEFNIYGTGDTYDKIVAPIKDFENVHLYPKFLSHDEISKVHKENGIGLFATRYDAQGVSMCEAAMSGLAIVSSQNDAIAEFLPGEEGILADTEKYKEYADIIEEMYKSPERFKEISKSCHEKVYSKCRFEKTVQKEIDLISSIKERIYTFEPRKEQKVLSIIIPSYNVATYLYHGVFTILNHENANKIQVIIVNDGSKDNTVEVAKTLQEKFGEDNITIIDKENGGHGSTINEGLKVATGKYVRIIDGDDWVDSKNLKTLIDYLEKEDSDIVITNYSEDRADINEMIKKEIYDFMIPGNQYVFDDLCYEGYGFGEWGPILATSNFKTELLQNKMKKLTEKSFYIDMEFDAYSIAYADTITYYPLDIYRYFIGRVDQSISKKSYSKNFKQHESVLFNLIDFYYSTDISNEKRCYILNKLIIPMLIAHYTILIEFLKSPKEYRAFEHKLSQYKEIYNDPRVATRMKRFHRKTNGIFVRQTNLIRKIASR